MMDLAYVCEWEKWAKSTYCPSLPLACAWSCRNLIAFTTDLRNEDQGERVLALLAWLGPRTPVIPALGRQRRRQRQAGF